MREQNMLATPLGLHRCPMMGAKANPYSVCREFGFKKGMPLCLGNTAHTGFSLTYHPSLGDFVRRANGPRAAHGLPVTGGYYEPANSHLLP